MANWSAQLIVNQLNGAQAPKGTQMKHIATLPAVDARIMIEQGLEHLEIDHDDLTVPLDCYFCPITGNLWHAYLGTTELYNVLSATVIASLEREFAPLCA